MDRTDADPGRLARLLLAAVLALAALRSLRSGKRLRGLLAAAGAVAVGYDTARRTEELEVPDAVEEKLSLGDDGETESDDEATLDDTGPSDNGHAADLVCADCGDPIVPGQNRGPNEENEIVHDDCQ